MLCWTTANLSYFQRQRENSVSEIVKWFSCLFNEKHFRDNNGIICQITWKSHFYHKLIFRMKSKQKQTWHKILVSCSLYFDKLFGFLCLWCFDFTAIIIVNPMSIFNQLLQFARHDPLFLPITFRGHSQSTHAENSLFENSFTPFKSTHEFGPKMTVVFLYLRIAASS